MNIIKNIRLQKYMANCGLGSRRFCETLISAGRVKVNNSIIRELGTKINPDNDKIECNGKILNKENLVTFIVNKPIKTICTSNDPKNRPTVLDLLKDLPERVYTIGRLDFMSEGLILVTNDGELAHKLSHPKYEISKTYKVTINKQLTSQELLRVIKGVPNKGELLKFTNIDNGRRTNDGFIYNIILKEGKNRHIRRVMDTIEKKIIRLKRVSIGPILLKNLKIGDYRVAKPSELKQLRKIYMKKIN